MEQYICKRTRYTSCSSCWLRKTAVLVERIIQKILRDEVDVDKLLVVTFTNLSAREMKHRRTTYSTSFIRGS